jgi:uncharacterized SAM-binding protein YcdF (DUF218 family)
LLIVLLVTVVLWLVRAPILTAAARSFIEDDGPQKADAIVVMGGDDEGNRILKGAQLATDGYAPIVIVSGPPVLAEHESDIMIHFAETKGYPASLFRSLPNDSNATREETAFIGKYLKSQGIHKILLVTSNFHTGRAAYLMRLQTPGVWVVVVPAPDRNFIPDRWWKTRGGQKTFALEGLKRVATRLGY